MKTKLCFSLLMVMIASSLHAQNDSLQLINEWTIKSNTYNVNDIFRASWQIGDSGYVIIEKDSKNIKYQIDLKTGTYTTRELKIPFFWKAYSWAGEQTKYLKEIRRFVCFSNTNEKDQEKPFISIYNENLDSIGTLTFQTKPVNWSSPPCCSGIINSGFYPRDVQAINGKLFVPGIIPYNATRLIIDPISLEILDTLFASNDDNAISGTNPVNKHYEYSYYSIVIPSVDSTYYVYEVNIGSAAGNGYQLHKFDKNNKVLSHFITPSNVNIFFDYRRHDIPIYDLFQNPDYSCSFMTISGINHIADIGIGTLDPYLMKFWKKTKPDQNGTLDYSVCFSHNSVYQFAFGRTNTSDNILYYSKDKINIQHIVFKQALYDDSKGIFSTDSLIVLVYSQTSINPLNDSDVIIECKRIKPIDPAASTLSFRIQSVTDVPNDLGGFVNIRWGGLNEDSLLVHGEPLSEYRLWKVLPDSVVDQYQFKRGSISSNLHKIASPYPDKVFQFEKSVPAAGFENYNSIVSTLADSSLQNPKARFEYVVTAHSPKTGKIFYSSIGNGVSVKNITGAPNNMSISDIQYLISSNQVSVTWKLPEDSRFNELKIEKTGFTWDKREKIGTPFYSKKTSLTDQFDAECVENYYKITPIDNFGNTSENPSSISVKLEELNVNVQKIRFFALSNSGFMDYVFLGTDSLASLGYDSGIDVKRPINTSFSIYSGSEGFRQNIIKPSVYEKYDLFLTGDRFDFPVQIFFDTLNWNSNDTYFLKIGDQMVTLKPNERLPEITDKSETIEVFHFPQTPNSVSQKENGDEFRILGNYPNPFNPVTKIEFFLERPRNISMEVFDITGRMVKSIPEKYFTSGLQSISFNAVNLPSGIYLYKLSNGYSIRGGKLLLVK